MSRDPLISIVIPTLNERGYLERTIRSALQNAQNSKLLEIIVVDAGSDDGTLESVEHLPCQTFRKPDFRFKKYLSLNFGLDQSRGSFVIFLDADTELPKGYDGLVRQTLQQGFKAGAFELTFARRHFLLGVLTFFNRIRYRFDQNFFGDQAIFCQRDFAKHVGGFPVSDLMEAALFCQRIRKYGGRLHLVDEPVKTSSRRFDEHGFWRVFWFDLGIILRFSLRRKFAHVVKGYWSGEVFRRAI